MFNNRRAILPIYFRAPQPGHNLEGLVSPNPAMQDLFNQFYNKIDQKMAKNAPFLGHFGHFKGPCVFSFLKSRDSLEF